MKKCVAIVNLDYNNLSRITSVTFISKHRNFSVVTFNTNSSYNSTTEMIKFVLVLAKNNDYSIQGYVAFSCAWYDIYFNKRGEYFKYPF